MLMLKEKEICAKKDTCSFAKTEAETCLGCTERNSTFVCDLDFLIEDFQLQPLLSCVI